jgi:hypothetical protein
MTTLTGALLLDAWDRAAGAGTLARPLSLLAAACPDRPEGTWLDVSLSDLEIELLRLRRVTFGDTIRGTLPCGSCGTSLEFAVSASSMMDQLTRLRPSAPAVWDAGGVAFSMRPVTTRDLLAVSSAPAPRRALLSRCVEVEPESARDAVFESENRALEEFNRLNEGAESWIALPCPACGVVERVSLDIAHFVWLEVRHAAIALLRQVHELAGAYGWSEAEILAMNGRRRAMYLEMART